MSYPPLLPQKAQSDRCVLYSTVVKKGKAEHAGILLSGCSAIFFRPAVFCSLLTKGSAISDYFYPALRAHYNADQGESQGKTTSGAWEQDGLHVFGTAQDKKL
ncbi:MAG TPA: hypothetical protein DCO77_10725 [Nitrospiraceae bacterium]|nr:hypothetical protein [Nitrospiraceae bacterium]